MTKVLTQTTFFHNPAIFWEHILLQFSGHKNPNDSVQDSFSTAHRTRRLCVCLHGQEADILRSLGFETWLGQHLEVVRPWESDSYILTKIHKRLDWPEKCCHSDGRCEAGTFPSSVKQHRKPQQVHEHSSLWERKTWKAPMWHCPLWADVCEKLPMLPQILTLGLQIS